MGGRELFRIPCRSLNLKAESYRRLLLITKKETKQQTLLVPLCPIRIKTNTSRDSCAQVFPRFESGTSVSSFDWFIGLSVSFVIGWSWFYDIHLKTTCSKVRKVPKVEILLFLSLLSEESELSLIATFGCRKHRLAVCWSSNLAQQEYFDQNNQSLLV